MIDGRPGLVMVPLSEGLPRSQLPMRRLMIVPRRRLIFLRRPSRRLVFMPPGSMTRRRLPVRVLFMYDVAEKVERDAIGKVKPNQF
uniref:Uncharacterized protein n=1 Tax=Magallana gigas TaxID=29159 RepID=K1R6M3_MAGGI